MSKFNDADAQWCIKKPTQWKCSKYYNVYQINVWTLTKTLFNND